MADKSLITDLLKTPSQIRKEREERLLTEGLAQAQLFNQGNRLGGVGGMFAGFGASQAAMTGRDIDRATTGLRSAASAATGKDFRRGEERVAAQQQEVLKGTDTTNLQSLKTRRQMFVDAGAPAKALEAIDRQIMALEDKKKAEIAADAKARAEAEQQAFENRLRTKADTRADAAAQREEEQFAQTMDYKRLTQDASLYSKFTPESIEARRTNPNASLIPITDTEERKALSSYGKQLQDEGLAYGSPEFNSRMQVYNQAKKDAIGTVRNVNVDPAKQVDTILSTVQSNPVYKNMQNRQEKIDLANGQLSRDDFMQDSEAIAVVQRTVSEIYNADTRAASEIDRFLRNKGITRTFVDWAATTLTGSISKETIDNYEGIIEAAQKVVNSSINDVVATVGDAYSGVEGIDQSLVDNTLKSLRAGGAGKQTTNTTAQGTSYTIVEDQM